MDYISTLHIQFLFTQNGDLQDATINLTEELAILRTRSNDDLLYGLRKVVGLIATSSR